MSEQKNYNEMSDSEKKKEDWMNSKWRPMMGWMYMVVCITDFVVFPVLWSVLHAIMHSPTHTQWQPLTLQGAGLFHIAMGAVLGLAAWGRTQEKMNGANNGGLQMPSIGGGLGAPSSGGFGAPAMGGGFSSQPPMMPRSTTVTTTSTFGAPAAPVMSSNGKLGPAPVEDPEI